MGKNAGPNHDRAPRRALIEGLPVGLFSMEMPKAQVWNRLIALTASVHLSNIKRPERLRDGDWTRITEAVDRLRLCALSINDQTGLTIGQVRSKDARAAPPARPARAAGRGLPGADERHRPQDQPAPTSWRKRPRA